MKELVIRLATIKDIEELVRIRIIFLREINDLKGKEEEVQNLKTSLTNYFSDKIPKNEFKAWVVEINGKIVATSGLVIISKPGLGENISGIEGYVLNMYTYPEWRGKNIGSQLLTKIVEYMKTIDSKKISLHAEEDAISLYEKFGFNKVNNEMILRLK